jgi:acyl-CoA-binding protein
MEVREKKYDSDGFSEAEEESTTLIDFLYNKSVIHVRKHTNSISKEDLLYFYARFKFINEGVCNLERPSGLFNFEAKSKWDAWKTLTKEFPTLSKDQAKEQYFMRLDSIEPTWKDGLKETCTEKFSEADNNGTFGIRMSQMAEIEDLDEGQKTCFDLCKEGDLKKLVKYIEITQQSLDQVDENGMTLMMWACDRGYVHIVEYLMSKHADLNIQDTDGQTSLHYAVSCEHFDIVKLLLNNKNINVDLMDNDGSKAVELTDNKDIIEIFNQKI